MKFVVVVFLAVNVLTVVFVRSLAFTAHCFDLVGYGDTS